MFRKALTIEDWRMFDDSMKRAAFSATTMTETEFENFYNEHSRPLWAYARRIANSAEIADDVVQESFLRFLGATQRASENPKAYLYRIATNLVYDSFRRSARETTRQTMTNEEPAYEPFAAGDEITKFFDKLNAQERALLWLAYVEGHQHNEIAAMLGLKSLSVRVLLFRARRKLAALLETSEVRKI